MIFFQISSYEQIWPVGGRIDQFPKKHVVEEIPAGLHKQDTN